MTAARARARLARWRGLRTVRGRLLALVLGLVTIGFVAAALITDVVVRHVLVDRLDQQLVAAGDRFAIGLEHNDHDADNHGPGGRYENVSGQLAGTLGARILDGTVTDVAIVGSGTSSTSIPGEARAQLARLTLHPSPQTVRLDELGAYRVTVVAGRDGDLQVTGLPYEPVEDTIDKLAVFEAIVFAATLAVVAIASTSLVRLMLRPLSRMADTAADVADLPLNTGGVSLPHRVDEGAHGNEIDKLARAFNAMLEQVETALVTRARSEDKLRRFIADASHELRTPVAVVRSHAELAQRASTQADMPVPPEITHSLERITAQAGRMGHLVEDLLLLARLDSGRPLVREPVDMARVVADAVTDVRAVAQGHIWRMSLPRRSVYVDGDAHALAQAVANLLSNAATHTPAGTTVTVSVAAADRVVLTVADTGPGMSPDLAERVFDRFVRGNDGTRSTTAGSSGLGLPIVAAIVAAHDGTIDLDTGPGGTTVRIELPQLLTGE